MNSYEQSQLSGVDLRIPLDLPKYLALAILDRRPSQYVLEGDGISEGTEIPIDTCNKMLKRICNILAWNTEMERWVVVQTRYLKGCPTIFVAEQERLGYKSKNAGLDAVWLQDGGIAFNVEGDNIQKAHFLLLHENNADFTEITGADGKPKFKRPDYSQDVFGVLETEVTASKEVARFQYEQAARNYLAKLVDTKSGQAVYNEDALEFLTQLFKLPKFEAGLGSETFVALLQKANEDPKKFIETIGSEESLIEADIQRGLAASAVLLDEQGAFFAINNDLIVSYEPRLSKPERFKALVDFMLNPANRRKLDQLRAQTVSALKKSTSVLVD